jgi:two-component system, cell cycle sensor histidine kinase and response regulator CckA
MVEDSEADARLVVRSLRSCGRAIVSERVANAESMRASLLRESWDVVICDWTMPSFGGAEALEVLKSTRLDIPFIVVSGIITEEMAVRVMRAGARDWVLKDTLARLAPALERELKEGSERARSVQDLLGRDEELRHFKREEAIGGLAAGVAHDFNNLLSVVLGYAELMHHDLPPGDAMLEGVEEIVAASHRATTLTKQLMAFSRTQVSHPRATDLNDVMLGMENMLRRLIGEDVEIAVVASAGLEQVMIDRGNMEQVILNLVLNARDAMPGGGTLTIETRNVDLDERSVQGHLGAKIGPHVALTVTDTGIGMDEATRARIFERFFTTKDPGRGTGLGLATVFAIVQRSGGTIWTTSAPGLGTTFTIHLPRLAQAIATVLPPTARPVAARLPRGEETILVVEDDRAVRKVVRTVLERQGYNVLAVANGGEALLVGKTCSHSIDLLLTDLVMPRMGGRELNDRLLPLRPALKVVYVSGYADGAFVHDDRVDSKLVFLQKPVAAELLLCTVRDVLDAVRT